MSERGKKLLSAALKGNLLLVLKVDEYLPQICVFFILASLLIGLNLGIENTVHQKEKNKLVLENLKSIHTEMTCKLTSLDSVCEVEKMLEDMGSNVKIPQKKATKIKLKK